MAKKIKRAVPKRKRIASVEKNLQIWFLLSSGLFLFSIIVGVALYGGQYTSVTNAAALPSPTPVWYP